VLLWASKRKVFPFKVFILVRRAHTAFLRVLLATIGAKSGWRVTILTSENAERHPAFRRLCEEFRNKLDTVVAHEVREPPFVGRLLGSFYAEQYANFKSLKRERSLGFALVPYMEAVGVQNLALRACFGNVAWAVIPHGLRIHFRDVGIKAPRRGIDVLQRWYFRRMLKISTLAGVFTLDRDLLKWANHPKEGL
jgi:hypothetical protein